MMLASPLLPSAFSSSHPSEDSPLQYRPARDKDAFNSLLPPPIEFVEGSSSGALAVPVGKYEPINASPKPSKPDVRPPPRVSPQPHAQPLIKRPETPKPPTVSPFKPAGASTPNPKSVTSLHTTHIDTSWPEDWNRGTGLYNSGNTCFLNSALQCLLHTPPLLRMLTKHKCQVDKGFCMSCSLRAVMVEAHTKESAFSPTPITTKLQVIAKHLRKGRQEDSHEFLRYAIDALQKSCLAAYPQKADPKLADTTWVHKIFGGQLRSRVTCRDCGHNSDTFDRILDLSVDIHHAETLKDALKKFVAVDHLKGADKYKCEKCKKAVNAEKRFTLHEAPIVLTVHLKRFSPLGRKIGHAVHYDEEFSLQPYMSEGRYGPVYSLYGVICHAGGGPNSGHYYAFVKSRDGRWWEMNDESVSPTQGPPRRKNAYMLFYILQKGQSLQAAVKSAVETATTSQPRPGLAASMKKRKERAAEEEDTGTKVAPSGPFIGPLLPSPVLDAGGSSEPKRQKMANGVDPQAELVKKKIQAAAKTPAKGALTSLAGYASDSSDEDKAEQDGEDDKPEVQRIDGRASSPPAPAPPSSQAPSSPPIPPAAFYASPNNSNSKKRKAHDSGSERRQKDWQHRGPNQSRSSGYRGSNLNPFATLGQDNRNARRRPPGL